MNGNGLKSSRQEPGDANGWPTPSAPESVFWKKLHILAQSFILIETKCKLYNQNWKNEK